MFYFKLDQTSLSATKNCESKQLPNARVNVSLKIPSAGLIEKQIFKHNLYFYIENVLFSAKEKYEDLQIIKCSKSFIPMISPAS